MGKTDKMAVIYKRRQYRKFGPNTYVAVLVIPKGVDPPKILRKDVLRRRGIKMYYFGEGYSKYDSPKSRLGKAKKKAEQFAKRINKGKVIYDWEVT